jgi:hypothetical protein
MLGVVFGLTMVPVAAMAMAMTKMEVESSHIKMHPYVKSITTTTSKANYWTGTKILKTAPHDCVSVTQKLVTMTRLYGLQLPTISHVETRVACPEKKKR